MRARPLLALACFFAAGYSRAECGDCDTRQCIGTWCECLPDPGKCPPKVIVPTPGAVLGGFEKLGNDTITTVQKAGGDTVRTLQKAGGDTVSTIEKAGGDTVQTLVKAGQDASATYIKAWMDTGEQARKSFDDAVDAAKAAANFAANQLKTEQAALEAARKRVSEGKVVDAMWGLGVEPLQGAEANFAKATQESKVIASAAATAAAVYGGPGGAAAYAAWSTYRATGDADLALRAGLLAAATAQAGSTTAAMPAGTAGEVLKKAALAGAAGGIAVAASGGDENAIKDGFLKSAGAVLVQAASDQAQAFSPKAKDAWDTVHCISARDVDCLSKTTWARDAKGRILLDSKGKPRIDPKKLDPNQYVGKWSRYAPGSVEAKKNDIIAKISQLPKVPAIPLMNNRWVLTWSNDATTSYGKPAVVLTQVGPKPPFISKVTYQRGAASLGPVASGHDTAYACTLAGIDRSVTVQRTGGGCRAIYRREDGIQDVVWQSDHFPDICASKAAAFVQQLGAKGIRCQAKAP